MLKLNFDHFFYDYHKLKQIIDPSERMERHSLFHTANSRHYRCPDCHGQRFYSLAKVTPLVSSHSLFLTYSLMYNYTKYGL